MKNNILKSILIFLPIIFCVGILIFFFINGIKETDELIIRYVSENISHSMVETMKLSTNIFSMITFMLVIVLIIINSKNKKIGLFYVINMGLCYVINFILKLLISRDRPIEYMLVLEDSYSFPSAHSMLSVAFYGFLAYLIIKYVKNKSFKLVGVILSVIFTLLVGVSRVCLGVHYPTDVLCGFLFGYVYLLAYIYVIKKYI